MNKKLRVVFLVIVMCLIVASCNVAEDPAVSAVEAAEVVAVPPTETWEPTPTHTSTPEPTLPFTPTYTVTATGTLTSTNTVTPFLSSVPMASAACECASERVLDIPYWCNTGGEMQYTREYLKCGSTESASCVTVESTIAKDCDGNAYEWGAGVSCCINVVDDGGDSDCTELDCSGSCGKGE